MTTSNDNVDSIVITTNSNSSRRRDAITTGKITRSSKINNLVTLTIIRRLLTIRIERKIKEVLKEAVLKEVLAVIKEITNSRCRRILATLSKIVAELKEMNTEMSSKGLSSHKAIRGIKTDSTAANLNAIRA